MAGLLIAFIIAGILLLLFVILLIAGIIKKKKGFIRTSLVAVLLFVISAVYIGYKVVKKTKEVFKPRTGMEAYISFWGKPQTDCVEMLNFQDQYIPKIDYAIWFHFNTCPDELQRILTQHEYEEKEISTAAMNSSGPLADNEWFKPESLGDSILMYEFRKDDYGNSQTIFSNPDRTEVYVKDVQD